MGVSFRHTNHCHDRPRWTIRVPLAFTQLLGTKHIRTTAYHPCANGLVERLHRQLKGALKGHPHQEQTLVLLGIRTALKEDIGCTTAELVYGTIIRLPGAFFTPQPADNTLDPTSYVAGLRSRMQALKATPPRSVPHPDTDIGDRLRDATHVFIRHDAVRKPLQPPYDGPYKVLDRASKYFTVEVKGRRDTISVDRLKPACLDGTIDSSATESPRPQAATPPPPLPSNLLDTAPPVRTTRSGRHVHWPAHLADFAL